MYRPQLTTHGVPPTTFTVVCIADENGVEVTHSETFDCSSRAQRWATEQMKWEGTKRVSCPALHFSVPGDFWNENGTRIGADHTHCATVHDLLLCAPAAQVARCRLAWKAVAAGDWTNAAHFLRNAGREEAGSGWARNAHQLAAQCERNAMARAA